MFSMQDANNGMIKLSWKDVRDKVRSVEPHFAKLVDKINPDASFPLYLAFYPYGELDADTQSTLFPDQQGGFYRLTDANVPNEVMQDLGYSVNNTPLGMVLEKQIECFVNLKSNKITIPTFIYTPGKIFPLTRILNNKNNRIYAPYGLLCSTAGARSAFMLPNIGCSTNHVLLQRDFKIKTPAPKTLYDHWQIFKEIARSKIANSDWRCCVMYFSEKWIEKINSDSAWNELKQYLQELAWHQCEYEINRIHYDMIFSIIQQKCNLKPNPYLTDTAKHLFTTALGISPGYAPAVDDSALPVKILQKAFIESYGLKKYTPTVFHPIHYNFETEKYPIYYSLHNPSTLVFSPKSREVSSTLNEIRELEHIMNVFSRELAKDDGMCSPVSMMNKLAKKIKLNYFHSKIDSHGIVQLSSEIPANDERFNYLVDRGNSQAGFANDGPFVRGCIRISN
jgi:hypothetical protein